MEKIIRTKVIFDGRVVHLRVHDVELSDGTMSIRELIEHQGAIAVVALNDQHDVLLVRQYRIGAQQVLIEIPAGLLEAGEEPQIAATRELQEETGFRPLKLESLGGFYMTPGYTTEYIHLFIAWGYEHAPLEQDQDEFVEPFELPLQEALAMIDRGEIIEAKTMLALLKVARHIGL